MTRRWIAFAMATAATATGISLSMLAGWQRGGSLAERLAWVAIGVVLVVSAHLLPALASNSPSTVRAVAGLLWACCTATACFGHATFFLFAQQHAGMERAETVSAVTASAVDRSLTQVGAERATVTRQLAFARLQRCPRNCGLLEARRVTLAAKLDALNAESDSSAPASGRRPNRDPARRITGRSSHVTTRCVTGRHGTACRSIYRAGIRRSAGRCGLPTLDTRAEIVGRSGRGRRRDYPDVR